LKIAEFLTCKGSWPWSWIGSYCSPSCISHRPLPTQLIADGWTDGRTFDTHFITSTRRSRPNSN